MPIKKKQAEVEQMTFLEPQNRGEILISNEDNDFYPVYQKDSNTLFQGDSIKWLQSLPEESVDLIFADPPYNIRKAEWDKFESQEKYIS